MGEKDLYSDDWAPGRLLEGDVGGRALGEMRDVLLAGRGRLKRVLDQGVTPQDFKKGELLLGAYEAAVSGLEKSWKRRHQS